MRSLRISSNLELMKAAANSPPLKLHSRGAGVAELQELLRDFGQSLPISFPKGKPDGIFGDETEKAVRSFQAKHGLGVDGQAGAKTISKMDELIMSKPYLDSVSPAAYDLSLLADAGKPLKDRRAFHV
jgi:peptidoglycan hydrolase-like protein with peptidoglycan-binding domain